MFRRIRPISVIVIPMPSSAALWLESPDRRSDIIRRRDHLPVSERRENLVGPETGAGGERQGPRLYGACDVTDERERVAALEPATFCFVRRRKEAIGDSGRTAVPV